MMNHSKWLTFNYLIVLGSKNERIIILQLSPRIYWCNTKCICSHTSIWGVVVPITIENSTAQSNHAQILDFQNLMYVSVVYIISWCRTNASIISRTRTSPLLSCECISSSTKSRILLHNKVWSNDHLTYPIVKCFTSGQTSRHLLIAHIYIYYINKCELV